jgi:hypothetical protein
MVIFGPGRRSRVVLLYRHQSRAVAAGCAAAPGASGQQAGDLALPG